MGGGLGHAVRVASIGQVLHEAGWDVVVAGRDEAALRQVCTDTGLALVAAPHPPMAGIAPAAGLHSMWDTLLRAGYGDAEALSDTMSRWADLVRECRAGIVIADFSPALSLWARHRLPLLQASHGYLLPPPRCGEDIPDLLPSSRARVLEAASRACARHGARAPNSLADFSQGDGEAVTTLALFDPFDAERAAPALGPLEDLPRPHAPSGEGIFCYYDAAQPVAAPLLEALELCGRPVEIYLRGAPTEWQTWLESRPGFRTHRRPAPLHEALARNRLVVSYGSLGLAQATLSAGRAHLMIPMQNSREQKLNGERLRLLGLARILPADAGRARIGAALAALLDDTEARRHALMVAETFADETARSCLPAIREMAERLRAA